MRKILLIAFALIALLVLCVGCVETAEDELLEEVDEVQDDVAEDLEASLGDMSDSVTDTVSNESDEVSDESTPCTSYEKFMDVKGQSFEALTGSIDETADFYLGASFELLAVSLVDLQTLDLSFVTDDKTAAETAAGMMGIEDMNLEYTGEDFSFSYTGDNAEAYVRTGKYDAATDSLTCKWTEDGAETLMLEYTKYGEGYAAQYYITDDVGTSIIKLIIDGENIVLGVGEDSPKPDSIYKAAPTDFTFADDCTSIYKLVDGIGTYKCADGDYEF